MREDMSQKRNNKLSAFSRYCFVSTVYYLLLTVYCFLGICFAESSSTTGATFLKQAIGTRAAGMGEAFCAVADDLSAVYYNPAGLVQLNVREPIEESIGGGEISYLEPRLIKLRNKQITAMYLKGLVDTNYGFLGYEQPLSISGLFGQGIVGIGGSLVTFQGGDIEVNVTNLDGSFKSSKVICAEQDYFVTFTYSEYVSMIKPLFIKESRGRNFIGINFKLIHSTLGEEYSANTFAMDLGWLYKSIAENVSFGINLQNLGKGIKYREEEDPLPFSIRVGIAYTFGPFGCGVGACDLIVPLDNKIKTKANLGLEYWFKDMIATRIGYKHGYDLDSFTYGIGFKMKGWRVDYAFSLREEINSIYQVSLTLDF